MRKDGDPLPCGQCGGYTGHLNTCPLSIAPAAESEDFMDNRSQWFIDMLQQRVDQGVRHPSSQRFHDILKTLGSLHDKKQLDYGTDEDPFNNIRASAKEWGIPAWVGAMLRATDKVRRLQKFADKGELANESVIDAFDDLAVYAVIARVMYEEEELETQKRKVTANYGSRIVLDDVSGTP